MTNFKCGDYLIHKNTGFVYRVEEPEIRNTGNIKGPILTGKFTHVWPEGVGFTDKRVLLAFFMQDLKLAKAFETLFKGDK